jgi:hypothetical protein
VEDLKILGVIVIPESNGSQVWRLPLTIYVLDIVSGLSTLVDV